MKTKQFLILAISIILLSIPTVYGGLRYFRYYHRQEYDKRRFANALYEPIAIDAQKQIIEVYEKRLGLDFPDSTQIVFANAEKGDLLEDTYVAFLKLKINPQDRGLFETILQKTFTPASTAEKNYFLNWYFAPKGIWTPKSLKEYQIYTNVSKMHKLCIGTDTKGNIIIYLSYATI